MADFEKVRRAYIYNITVFLGMGLGNGLNPTHLLMGCLLIGLTGFILLPSQIILKNPLRQETLEESKRLIAPYKISPLIYFLSLAACLFIIWICMRRGVRVLTIFNYVVATFLLGCAAFNGLCVLRMKPKQEAL